MDRVAARGVLAFPAKPAGHPLDHVLHPFAERTACRRVAGDLRPQRRYDAARPRMIAMCYAQIAIEESLLWIACIRRQSVNAAVRLRECTLHGLGFQRVLGGEVGIEGAV